MEGSLLFLSRRTDVVLRGRGAPRDVSDGDGRSREPGVAAGLRTGGGGRIGDGRPRPKTPSSPPVPTRAGCEASAEHGATRPLRGPPRGGSGEHRGVSGCWAPARTPLA